MHLAYYNVIINNIIYQPIEHYNQNYIMVYRYGAQLKLFAPFYKVESSYGLTIVMLQ